MSVADSDCFKSSKENEKVVLELWRDGSGKAKVGEMQLNDFVRMADESGRQKIVNMLRQAADLIESGVL